jgi:hypothetical protein
MINIFSKNNKSIQKQHQKNTPLKNAKIIKKRLLSKNPSYNTIAKIINNAIANIHPKIKNVVDGRIASALSEQSYITQIKTNIHKINPAISVVIPPKRAWCDLFIAGIPINIKITKGGTDNVFNKNMVHYTLFHKVIPQMSYKDWSREISTSKITQIRRQTHEYHYLVYNKKTNESLFKSILDLYSYKSNPSNILQINWTKEFKYKSYKINNEEHIDKKIILLETVQQSIKEALMNMEYMANINITDIL